MDMYSKTSFYADFYRKDGVSNELVWSVLRILWFKLDVEWERSSRSW